MMHGEIVKGMLISLPKSKDRYIYCNGSGYMHEKVYGAIINECMFGFIVDKKNMKIRSIDPRPERTINLPLELLTPLNTPSETGENTLQPTEEECESQQNIQIQQNESLAARYVYLEESLLKPSWAGMSSHSCLEQTWEQNG